MLQEKHQNKDPRRKISQKKITFADMFPKVFTSGKLKENRPRSKSTPVPSRRRSESNDKNEVQRRQQALEAMQILEQRRQRMIQQNLVEEMEEMSMNPVKETRNEAMEEKRLEAKRLKEKRIRMYLAEQEAGKTKEIEPIRKPSQKSNLPIPVYSTHRRHSMGYKPRNYPLQLPKENEEYFQLPNPRIFIPSLPQKFVIRYSKDDLRSLNPYGYYCM